jgi:nitric oxide reductase subunit B
MFAASMLYTPETNIAVTEFWRWWVVHMWVEGVFEFFVTAVISVALVSMELVDQADAEKAILFEVFAIMGAGIVGVSHHYWWVGLPDLWVPIGTTFSTLEFVPLMFILYRSFGEYRAMKAQGEAFPYTLPLLFIIGSSVWNFVGGGVLGFFINLPVINYYEHGTYLTVAHAHTATFGAFGLLALGLGTYILRVVTPEAAWDPTWFRSAFWLTNVGLAVMTLASLLPVGFLQLRTAYSEGYDTARSLEFYEQPHVRTLLWARTLGDTPMILGALAFTAGAVRHLYSARRQLSIAPLIESEAD